MSKPPSLPITLLLALASGCARNVATITDAAVTPCAWRVAGSRDLPIPSGMTACALADLAPRGDGARALLRCEAEVGAVSTALHFLYAAYQRDARTVAVATMACGR